MKRIVGPLGKVAWRKKTAAVFVLFAATATALPAQTFTTLFSFDGTDGYQLTATMGGRYSAFPAHRRFQGMERPRQLKAFQRLLRDLAPRRPIT